MELSDIVDLYRHPIGDEAFGITASRLLDENGVLVLHGFIREGALDALCHEAAASEGQGYFCAKSHSVYLTPFDPNYDESHPANRKVNSSKGCICDDVVGQNSPLRVLYNDQKFQTFVKRTTGQTELHAYADPLSSINIHYATRDQELGWHFDNSSFAITLLLQKPDSGSRFEYIKDLRDAVAGDMNYAGVQALLDGEVAPDVLKMDPGTLVLFRGRNSIHRVSPNESDTTRMLAVLAYNSEPGISLSENARMTFYGRLD